MFKQANPTATLTSSKGKSPDLSPGARVPSPKPSFTDYFSVKRNSGISSRDIGAKNSTVAANGSRSAQIFDQNSPSSHRGGLTGTTNQTTSSMSTDEQDPYGSRRSSSAFDPGQLESMSRRSSVASVSFRPPQNPSLPQGHQRKTDGRRLRASSPEPVKFKRHVGFDNLPAGDATKSNTSSLTLNFRHQGYHPGRRSRTFMVGVDEHTYSDYALRWLLENMVDDGDEIICVRVVETPIRDKSYRDDAVKMMGRIQEMNTLNRAISIVLEYSVGKLHATFQQLIQIYHPSLLIVGTRGRSLGGIQGLVNTRNSFSKYCLQYSPVPVVVVRPDDKRKKKKEKRSGDPNRNTYFSMLAAKQGVHEADAMGNDSYDVEARLSPDEEAHRVAAALGLPAAFDPTIKPYSGPKMSTPSASALTLVSTPDSPPQRRASSPLPPVTNDSGEDDSGGDDDEDDFDVTSGHQALKAQREREEQAERAQRERLHAMEVGEAAALLKSGLEIAEDDEDEDDEESGEDAKAASGTTT